MESKEQRRSVGIGNPTANRGMAFLLPLLAILVNHVAIGISPVMVRLYALGDSNPLFFTFVRITVSIPVLFLASVVAERGKLTKPRHFDEVIRLAAVGVFLVSTHMTIVIAAYYIKATIIIIVQMLQPVVSMLLSVLLCAESPPSLKTLHGWGKVIAVVLTVTGSVVIATKGPSQDQGHVSANSTLSCTEQDRLSSTSSQAAAAYVLVVVDLLSNCLYLVLQKRLLYQKREYLRWKRHPVSLSAWATLLGYPLQLIALPATSLMTSTKCGQDVGQWTLRGRAIWVIEYQVVFNSTLCVLLVSWGMIFLTPSFVTFWVPTQLIVSLLMSSLVLDEQLNSLQYGFMVVVLLGFFLIIWSRRREEKIEEAAGKGEQLLPNEGGLDDGGNLVNEFALETVDDRHSRGAMLTFSRDGNSSDRANVAISEDEQEALQLVGEESDVEVQDSML